MLETMQAEIDQTEYWDANILDFYSSFFGDEVTLLIYNDADTSWKISFLVCYQVTYETDAVWRTIDHVRDMRKPQLGYYEKDITLSESKACKGFYHVSIDLAVLTAKIICKDIRVEQVPNQSLHVPCGN